MGYEMPRGQERLASARDTVKTPVMGSVFKTEVQKFIILWRCIGYQMPKRQERLASARDTGKTPVMGSVLRPKSKWLLFSASVSYEMPEVAQWIKMGWYLK